MIVTSLDRLTQPYSANTLGHISFGKKMDSQKFRALSAYNTMDIYQLLSNFSHSKDRWNFVPGPSPLTPSLGRTLLVKFP